MAIAVMTHLRLAGLKRDENKILDKLTERGYFESRATDALSYDLKRGSADLKRSLTLKQGKISFALKFLGDIHAKYRADADVTSVPDSAYSNRCDLITKSEFDDARSREYELLAVCDALQDLSFKLIDEQNAVQAAKAKAREYGLYSGSPLRFSQLQRNGDIVISLYRAKTVGDVEEVLTRNDCAYEVRDGDACALLTVVAQKNAVNEIDKGLSALGYVRCQYVDDCTAKEKCAALQAECADMERHIVMIEKSALDHEKHVAALRILYDVIGLEIERADAASGYLTTDETFVSEGWLPQDIAKSVVEELKRVCPDTFVQLLAAEERDEPPTLVVNNKIVKPYEEITNMYSPPKYREIDPNPIMAIFFFIFFGLMMGDAAYGVVLAVVGFVLARSKKFSGGAKNMLLLVAMGGISAIVWGILFGGYFAIDFGDAQIALWFNPLDEPMTMLIMCVVLGCVQITVGYIIKFVALCKERKPFSAIFDPGSIILLFIALALVGFKLLLGVQSNALVYAAIAVGGLGICFIIFAGGRNSNKLFGKMFGGFKGLYGLVNLLSDVMSYCRLFGLGLATGAIGLAFNTLGSILFEIPGVGYIIGVILLIPLHVFNIAIGILGAYVHNARLQFLEFYGKFYNGGGRLFNPLGSHGKYTRFA